MRSEFDTLEQYQESMKEFNENTRMGFEEFIQSHGSDRNKLQLRCTPYTSKKGGYGSFDLDFGLCVYQHQQSKIDELKNKNTKLVHALVKANEKSSHWAREYWKGVERSAEYQAILLSSDNDLEVDCFKKEKEIERLHKQVYELEQALKGEG